MRPPSKVCPRGHKMAGKNLLWHKRYDKAGKQYMARECRACANDRYRINRKVKKQHKKQDEAFEARVEARLKEIMGTDYRRKGSTREGRP